MGAFDQARDIRQHQGRILVQAGNAQVGFEGGERVSADLGTRRRDRRQKGRFAGIGRTDDADIGDQLELQAQVALFARLALLRQARRLVR